MPRRATIVAVFAIIALAPTLAALSFEGCTPFSPDANAPPGTDASLTQDGALTDAGNTDTSTTPPQVPFCKQAFSKPPALCKDFDDGQPPFADFENIEGAEDGGITLDTTNFVSPPAAMRVIGANPVSTMERSFDEMKGGFDVQMKLRVGTDDGGLPATTYLIPVRIATVANSKCAVDLRLDDPISAAVDLSHETQSEHATLLRRPIPGKWTDVRFDLQRFDTGPAKLRVEVDGVEALAPRELPCVFEGRWSLTVGLIYSPDVEIRFDDLAVIPR